MTTSPNTLVVTVTNIGTFTFARRNLRLDLASRAEFARLTEGAADMLSIGEVNFSYAVADLKTLLLEGPDGWTPNDIDNFDAFDEDALAKVMTVWNQFRAKEDSFRSGGKAKLQTGGEGSGAIDGVLVSPEVQPSAD